VRRKRRATIVPQVKSLTTSRNTRACRELTLIRKSKRLQKQLSWSLPWWCWAGFSKGCLRCSQFKSWIQMQHLFNDINDVQEDVI
jgi:hypothetical protein